MPFMRDLDTRALAYLKTSPQWWRDVLAARYRSTSGEERPLLIAVRDGYLSIYADGQAVLEAHFDARSGRAQMRGKIHRKYVLGPDAGDGYLVFDGATVSTGTQTIAYEGPETLQSWTKRALNYAKEEKEGVAAIVQRHANIIDVEMAMPARRPSTAVARAVAPKVDIVALEDAEDGIRVVFYEAKLFSNPELRADNLQPRVLTQLATYEAYLSERGVREEAIKAYRDTCRILCEIHVMRGTTPCDLVRKVAQGTPLDVDPKPRLVVFGYTADRVGRGSYWERHEEALRARCTLLMAERPEDVRLPCAVTRRG